MINSIRAEMQSGQRRQYLLPGSFLAVAVIGFLYSVIRAVAADNGTYNLHAQQALSFIHGELFIENPVNDVAFFNDHYYSVFPPFPAILLIPVVLVFGVAAAKGTVLAIALTAIGAVALFRVFVALQVHAMTALWLAAGFFLGTGYWFAVLGSSTVWTLGQVVAVNCVLIACYFLIAATPSLWSAAAAGLFLGFAFNSRQVTIYLVIFALAYLWFSTANGDSKKFVRFAGALVAPFAACVALYLLFNGLRFGSALESGYRYLVFGNNLGGERFQTYGLFNTAYIPFNFSSMFFNGFQLDFGGTAMTDVKTISPWGTSLLFASPFLLTAFYARGSRWITAAWVAIGLSLLHMLLYFNNGYVQVNTNRFTLDFLPLMMVLCGLGIKSAPPILWKAGIVWAVALNFLALVVLTASGVPAGA